MRKFIFFMLILTAPVLMLGCESGEKVDNKVKDSAKSKESDVEEKKTDPSNAEKASTEQPKSVAGPVAVIETTKGTIVMELYPDVAPKTVENFKSLTNKGFYNGLVIFRVEPGLIQTGSPTNVNTGGPGYTIDAEFNEKKHIAGTVAMARAADINSAGSQFYICKVPLSMLDGQYTIFGQVIEGMDALNKIQKGDVMTKVYMRQ